MKDIDLTANQRRVLACIERHMEHNGVAPSLREISEYLGLSSHSSAQDYVEALIRKGALERLPQHRGLRLAQRSRAPAATLPLVSSSSSTLRARPRAKPLIHHAATLPLVGRVAAGSPIMSEGNVEANYAVDPALFRPRADFLLRVVGMSMRDAGIVDGDLLAVHRTRSAGDGSIVVARLDDEITVKRLQHRRDRLLLLPENPDFEPIEVDPRHVDSFAIEGLYVGIIRRS